ncbi:hypothetical protein D3877_11845 [Azospirillum cavernae]|uniref:SHOCT domain-containing protein n=2 Tax=Azospirillum cavernae TaxID=2320860 RepID=A0A418VUT6_9PROT|nr:hypothetical protein D3877_11845 [Azospirillum cavernae]
MSAVAGTIAPAGIPGFRLVSADDAKKTAGRPGDAAWAGDGVFGLVEVSNASEKRSIDELAASITSEDATVCGGEFLTGLTGTEKGMKRVYSVCRRKGASPINLFYVIVPRLGGGYLQLSIRSEGADVPARRAEAKLLPVLFPSEDQPAPRASAPGADSVLDTTGLKPLDFSKFGRPVDDGELFDDLIPETKKPDPAAVGPPRTPPTTPSIESRLAAIKDLLDRKVITQQEHDERRRAILGSL